MMELLSDLHINALVTFCRTMFVREIEGYPRYKQSPIGIAEEFSEADWLKGIGQDLVNRNYEACNKRNGTDEVPHEYEHQDIHVTIPRMIRLTQSLLRIMAECPECRQWKEYFVCLEIIRESTHCLPAVREAAWTIHAISPEARRLRKV